MTPDTALAAIESAKSAITLFPPECNLEETYKTLLVLVHPDRFQAQRRDRATKAAQRLADLYHSLTPPVAAPTVLGNWIVERPLDKGDVADLYLVAAKKDSQSGVLKIARSEGDNDLMDAELQALKALNAAEPATFHNYLPSILDSFQASDRRANVLSRSDGTYSLRQIREMLPEGVEFRHIVWMMNRLLSLIGYIERVGYAHGGITPDHLLYNPQTHGLTVVGWCSSLSVADGESYRIVANQWKESMYPQEVLRKWECGVGTDIYMAAKCMMYATASYIPPGFMHLLRWCLAESPAARPNDAWAAQDIWRGLAVEEYGPPTYLKLDLPIN